MFPWIICFFPPSNSLSINTYFSQIFKTNSPNSLVLFRVDKSIYLWPFPVMNSFGQFVQKHSQSTISLCLFLPFLLLGSSCQLRWRGIPSDLWQHLQLASRQFCLSGFLRQPPDLSEYVLVQPLHSNKQTSGSVARTIKVFAPFAFLLQMLEDTEWTILFVLIN